jgi:chromosome segregation ATPase
VLSHYLSYLTTPFSTNSGNSQFFLKGTQLSQLSQEYALLQDQAETMASILKSKRNCIPEMEKAYKSLRTQWEEAKAARDQRERLETLKHELAWSYVAELQQVPFLTL